MDALGLECHEVITGGRGRDGEAVSVEGPMVKCSVCVGEPPGMKVVHS